MNILFLHRNFPSQFLYLASVLGANPGNRVVFITNGAKYNIKGVETILYKNKRKVPDNCHKYLRPFEEAVIHGQGAAEAAIKLKQQGFVPDIIYGHSWGPTMFMKDVFPDVPLLCYFEWFYNCLASDFDFKKRQIFTDQLAELRCMNAHLLTDLYSCDAGISPTKFQKSQIPKEFQAKVKVLHDGVDTKFYAPNPNVKFYLKNKGITLTRQDEVLTYGTRGMEAYRGFPQFMEAASILLKKRPKLQVVIAGEDRVFYGPKPVGTTYKKMMLEKLDLDMDRVHFVGSLPYYEYADFLRVSRAHVYLTYPFVCSWSVTDSMSSACPMVFSGTAPIREFIEDGKEGLLFDFFDIEEQVAKIEYALDHKQEMEKMGQNARNKILQNYSVEKLLPQHIAYLQSIIQNHLSNHKNSSSKND